MINRFARVILLVLALSGALLAGSSSTQAQLVATPTLMAIWQPETGTWYVAVGNHNEIGQPVLIAQVGQQGDIPTPGDYDGDGRDELAVWRPEAHTFYVSLDNTDWVGSPVWIVPFDRHFNPTIPNSRTWGDTPVPGDYDGDGIDELAVWDSTIGEWIVALDNRTGWDDPIQRAQVGQTGDIPAPADYDGDGKDEFAVWRPEAHAFYVSLDNLDWGGSPTLSIDISGWDTTNGIPVPADYDGDRTDEAAIWRPADGMWLVWKENRVGPDFPVWGVQTGQSGDIPVPGDYDGDGIDEMAVWRPEDGTFYVSFDNKDWVAASRGAVQWGKSGDVPCPAAFLSRRDWVASEWASFDQMANDLLYEKLSEVVKNLNEMNAAIARNLMG